MACPEVVLAEFCASVLILPNMASSPGQSFTGIAAISSASFGTAVLATLVLILVSWRSATDCVISSDVAFRNSQVASEGRRKPATPPTSAARIALAFPAATRAPMMHAASTRVSRSLFTRLKLASSLTNSSRIQVRLRSGLA